MVRPCAKLSIRWGGELLFEELSGTLNFQPAHLRARKHIPAWPHGDGDLSETMPARRMIEPHIAHQSRRTGRRADQSHFTRLFGGNRTGALETRAHRVRVPEPCGGFSNFHQRDVELFAQ